MKKSPGIKNYMSLVKFSHTIFALPFALIGYFIAVSEPEFSFDWKIFAAVIACMVFARSAAMGFNRYLDRDIDSKNPRTAVREIPAGKISPKAALWFVIISSVLFISTTWFINLLVFCLSPIALLVVLGYSYTKRFTALCHFVLGLGLSLAPIGAYLAVTGSFALLPVLFSLTVLTWVSGFDIMYALQDVEFDSSEKLNSIPVFLGKKKALGLSVVVHIISVLLLSAAIFLGKSGIYGYIGGFIYSALLLYQHMIVKPDDLSKINLAFFTTNGIASVVFAAFYLFDLWIMV